MQKQKNETKKPIRAKGMNAAFMRRLTENKEGNINDINDINVTKEHEEENQAKRVEPWIKKG